MGFDGNSSDQNYQVDLIIGTTTLLTMHGTADLSVGRQFGDLGPASAINESVSVKVTGDAAGDMVGNLIYRITM